MTNDENGLVILEIFYNMIDSLIIKSIFEDNGIKAYIHAHDQEPHVHRSNGVRLYVARKDFERAKKIYEDTSYYKEFYKI